MQSLTPRVYPDTKPTFDYHDAFEQNVIAWMEQKGFMCHSATYHKTLPKGMANILQSRYSPNANYLRGRADRIAVHATMPVEFEFECKTHKSQTYHDMTVELSPLCMHIMKSRHEIECLYIYKDGPNEKGFWVTGIGEILNVREVKIPERWSDSDAVWFESLARQYIPRVKATRCRNTPYGSNDPYVIIDRSDVETMRDWRDLVTQKMVPKD